MENNFETKLFLQVEQKYKLNELEYEGYRYWPFVRFEIFNYGICTESLGLRNPEGAKNLLTIPKITKLLFQYFFGRTRCGKKDILVLSHERRIFDGRKYICPYTDCIIDNKYDAVFLESPFEFGHLKPTASENVLYTDRYVLNAMLRIFVKKHFAKSSYKKIKDTVKNSILPAISELRQVYNWSGDADRIAGKITDNIIHCQYERKIYRKLIENISPKIILETVYYDRKKLIINEIAKELGIRTIELQHGTMHENHLAYQFSDYDCERKIIPELPDTMFIFSDYWKSLVHVPIEDENLIVTGFPRFEEKKSRYADYERKDKRTTILFVSQLTIGKELSLFASRLSKILDSDRYRIIYKFHPSEYSTWKEKMPYLAETGIEIVDDSSIDLYELFAQSDFQIGVYSTALFEGIGFGLETMIYTVGHYKVMNLLVEKKFASFVNNEEEAFKLLDKECEKHAFTEEFWKSNALVNIRNYIDEILDK